jgi:hypothetical protein
MDGNRLRQPYRLLDRLLNNASVASFMGFSPAEAAGAEGAPRAGRGLSGPGVLWVDVEVRMARVELRR